MEKKPKNLWKLWTKKDVDKYQTYVTISTIDSTNESEGSNKRIIKNHLEIHPLDIVECYGLTQNPNTNEYMMVLEYCDGGNLRNYWINSKNYKNCKSKIVKLRRVTRGLLDIHNAGFIHKDFHSAIQICKGHRPKISEDVPKLLADLIIKCWDAEIENRPTAKELYQLLKKWVDEIINIEGIYYSDDSDCSDDGDDSDDSDSENIENDSIYYSDDNDCSDDNVDDSENIENDESENIQTHPQAIYTSRLLNFRNLPKPINSSDLSSFQFNSDANYAIQSTSTNPISVQLSELELNEFW
ncbi:kinase-like domain-containing protein [Rhizophagus clarus]|uniref:Kinase-like domain-containing protein n=1 Tax=Rhizophagus clarus TaxID=94130 RepID=A0A8H3QQW2_9GLOM|nr:kinase-like domain-containing protein [Rhizophagus clarus]